MVRLAFWACVWWWCRCRRTAAGGALAKNWALLSVVVVVVFVVDDVDDKREDVDEVVELSPPRTNPTAKGFSLCRVSSFNPQEDNRHESQRACRWVDVVLVGAACRCCLVKKVVVVGAKACATEVGPE